MISYTTKSAFGAATAEALEHRLRAEGLSVWLDVRMNQKSEAAMEEGVRNSKVVLALISDDAGPGLNYFERPFCIMELRWAMDAGVHVQPVVSMANKLRIGELLAQAPLELRHRLGAIDFIDLNRTDARYWEVGVGILLEAVRASCSGAKGGADGGSNGGAREKADGGADGGAQ